MVEPIKLHISPRIIPSIASLYDDINRILLEYVDNSLDSAEEYYNKEANSYSRPIEIIIGISGSSGNVTVQIYDNCAGIKNLTKIIQNIGDSDKKAQPWTNGQFGYGIYSFMACCNILEIVTSLEDSCGAEYIAINKEQFHTQRQEDVLFPPIKTKEALLTSRERSFLKPSYMEYPIVGTLITLSNFDRKIYKSLDAIDLKEEIEKHFELLLLRENLNIKIIDKKKTYVCEPFDYSQLEGEVYEDKIFELLQIDRGGQRNMFRESLPLHIFIKVTKGKEINKKPVFVCKGRRIGEVKNTRSFNSKHKSELWDHPNVTGYIDLSDFLEPMISRIDFKVSKKRRAVYDKLLEIEPLILDVVKDVNKASEDSHYRNLEDHLSKALSKLARLDALTLRKEYITGSEINLDIGSDGKSLEEGFGRKDKFGEKKSNGSNLTNGQSEGNGLGIGGFQGLHPGKESDGNEPIDKMPENPFDDTEFKGQERKRSGFNIRIVDIDPDVDEKTNEPMRSQLIGGEIRIFKRHPDFEARIKSTRSGKQKITQRLITYLAGEITVHYKDKFHNKIGQPEYNKYMFVDLVAFIYRFENMLSDLVGSNLSDLGD